MPKQPTHKETSSRQTYDNAERGTGFAIADEETAKLAYQLWLQRGQPEGSPEEDWYRAQELLRSGQAVTASSFAD